MLGGAWLGLGRGGLGGPPPPLLNVLGTMVLAMNAEFRIVTASAAYSAPPFSLALPPASEAYVMMWLFNWLPSKRQPSTVPLVRNTAPPRPVVLNSAEDEAPQSPDATFPVKLHLWIEPSCLL